MRYVEADVEADKAAAMRCAESAGFARQRTEPDEDGFVQLLAFPAGGDGD